MTDYDALCARLRALYDACGRSYDIFAEAADAIAALVARVAELEAKHARLRTQIICADQNATAWVARAAAAEARVKELEATAPAAGSSE